MLNSYYRGKYLPQCIDSRDKLIALIGKVTQGACGLPFTDTQAFLCHKVDVPYDSDGRSEFGNFLDKLGIHLNGDGFRPVNLPEWFPDYYRVPTEQWGVNRTNKARMWLLADILVRTDWAPEVDG